MANSLAILGDIARADGDTPRAVALYERGLALNRLVGYRLGIAECLERQALLAGAAAAVVAALLGEAAALREHIGAPIPPVDHPAVERAAELARESLGDDAFAAMWASGAARSTTCTRVVTKERNSGRLPQ
jgi:hypothetical protein